MEIRKKKLAVKFKYLEISRNLVLAQKFKYLEIRKKFSFWRKNSNVCKSEKINFGAKIQMFVSQIKIILARKFKYLQIRKKINFDAIIQIFGKQKKREIQIFENQ